ncbi:hypothetical protein LAZ67_2000490 [Cordylochernes scorpioides]|uniref:Transposase n=1 Tax=Cordylochernes scorpioides TaxID=51811 RepID=A0ABY6K0T9_9ARAC|nr:hypothetical protein LAZ67_2000490 [Cordylochernes scorpioides]
MNLPSGFKLRQSQARIKKKEGEQWYREFQRGKYGKRNAPRSGRSPSSVNEENITAVKKLLETDRHITLSPEFRHSCTNNSFHSARPSKICSLWVPHSLTDEQMTRCVSWCRELLKKCDNRSSRYVDSTITGDETCIYYSDVLTKAQNKVWIFEGEITPVSVRKSRSIKRKILAVSFNVRGVVSRVVRIYQKTVTTKWYTEEYLPKVVQSIKKLRSNSRTDTWLFHDDNAPAHRWKVCADYSAHTGLNCLSILPTVQTLHLCPLPSREEQTKK